MLVRAKRHITVKTKESETGAREESAQNYILLCVCEVGRKTHNKGRYGSNDHGSHCRTEPSLKEMENGQDAKERNQGSGKESRNRIRERRKDWKL